jgi:hypothetical protein
MVIFSNYVTITDLETFSKIPTKVYDGISNINKNYEDLVWLSITYQYNLLSELIYSLYTDELELCHKRIGNMLRRIIITGRSPILEGGGGRNRILGESAKYILYNLLTELYSIIIFRRNTSIVITNRE